MVKSIRASARPVILILVLFKVHPSAWWLNLLMLGWHRSQTSENRDPFCITLPGSALRAILSSRQSAHARVPATLEERAMPMIMRIFPLLHTFPGTAFILFLLRLVLETLLVLVFILFEEIGRRWPLIPDMPYLFFRDISLFPFWDRSQGSTSSLLVRRRGSSPAILMPSAKSNCLLADRS
jgi:hypothetical protein